jgi:hypothetical protein
MIESVVKKIHWEVSLFCEKVFFSLRLKLSDLRNMHLFLHFLLYFTCSHPPIHYYPVTITKYDA